jgi:hypothetical protein
MRRLAREARREECGERLAGRDGGRSGFLRTHHVERRGAEERVLTRDGAKRQRPDREHVGGGARWCAEAALRREELQRAERCFRVARHDRIDQASAPVGIDDDVRRRDVPVREAARVERLEPAQDVEHDLERSGAIQFVLALGVRRTVREFGDAERARRRDDEFHHSSQVPVREADEQLRPGPRRRR